MVMVPGVMVPIVLPFGEWSLVLGPTFRVLNLVKTPHFDHKSHFSNHVSYILGDLIPRRAHKSRKFAKMSKKGEYHSILPLFGNP